MVNYERIVQFIWFYGWHHGLCGVETADDGQIFGAKKNKWSFVCSHMFSDEGIDFNRI